MVFGELFIGQGCRKCNTCLQKSFWRDDKFWEKNFVWFLSLNESFSNFRWNFRIVLKNFSQFSIACFWGNNYSNKKKFSLLFLDFERKNFQTLANLSKSFCEFWHKVLAWLSKFLSTWTTSVIIISATFFQRTVFQIFSEFLFDRAHKHVNFVPGDFSRERINFEKSSCFIFVFSLSEFERKIFGFVESFGRFFKFAFCVCSHRIPGKTCFFPKKLILQLFSDFEPQKFDSEKQIGMLVKTASYVSRGTFGATFFEYVISRISIFWSWAKNFLTPMENFGMVVEVAFYVTRRPL